MNAAHPPAVARVGRLSFLVCLAVALGLSACSSKENRPACHAVTGKVLVKGKPAEGALVVFHPAQKTDEKAWPSGYPRGTAGADGTFTLSTFGTGDGAPAGEYVVVIQWPKVNPDNEEEQEDRLQGRYADPAAAKLKAQVKEGPNELPPFQLK